MRLTCWGLIRSPDFLVCDTIKFLLGWISGIRTMIFCCLLCSPALALLCQKDKRSRGGGDDPAFVPRKTFLNISLAFLSKSCKTRTDSPKRFFRCLDLESVIAAPQKVWTRCIAAYQESSAKWRWWYFLQNICNCQPFIFIVISCLKLWGLCDSILLLNKLILAFLWKFCSRDIVLRCDWWEGRLSIDEDNSITPSPSPPTRHHIIPSSRLLP